MKVLSTFFVCVTAGFGVLEMQYCDHAEILDVKRGVIC